MNVARAFFSMSLLCRCVS